MITIRHEGNFEPTTKFLKKIKSRQFMEKLNSFGQRGVSALASATPKESGRTASSWGYEIIRNSSQTTIHWTNTNENKGVNIAVILQYGHGTRHGGYVSGRDYINPVIRPVFDQILSDIWSEVIR